MNNIEKAALDKAISFLKAGKFTYAILDSDGTKHGDLEIVNKTGRKRGALKYPMGTLRNHFYPYIHDLKKDEGAEIPCGDFAPEYLRKTISAWACNHWGNKSHNIVISEPSNSLILFRTN